MKQKKQILTYSDSNPIITLTTDFGWSSEGIGIMKGVIYSLSPNATIIDLSHTVEPYSVLNGARIFETVMFLPKGIHIAVIDPTVGSERAPLAIRTMSDNILIGPDNGVLIKAAKALGGISEARLLKHRIENNSYVFDGRDVFAYNAALISSKSLKFEELGEVKSINSLVEAPFRDIPFNLSKLTAKVLHINRYGSLTVNIKSSHLEKHYGKYVTVSINNISKKVKIAKYFDEAGFQTLLLNDDGFGRCSISVNQGSAKNLFNAKINSSVTINNECHC